jgi:ribonuclease HII
MIIYLYSMLMLSYQEKWVEAGCDEAGRGCLAGPVFAAAVILPPDFYHPLLNDSKKVTEAHRYELKGYIEQHAIAYGVGYADHKEIDKINILKASFTAMHRAIAALKQQPELLLIDGNRFTPYPGLRHHCIVKGDSQYASIAAASILAKTSRDLWITELDKKYPQYGWKKNKGYGTIDHRRAIHQFGLSPYHRKTFQCANPDTQFELPLKNNE